MKSITNDNIPNTLDISVNENQIETAYKEERDIFIVQNSKGWKLIKNIIDSQLQALLISSRHKSPEESLESYGAKRLTSDAVEDFIHNIYTQVETISQNYIDKKEEYGE